MTDEDATEAPGLERFVRAVGWTSVALATFGITAPRPLASVAGVRDTAPDVVELLVRLASARQLVLGLAILSRRPTDVGRAARLFLPLTTLDAIAVGLAVRRGTLHPRAAAASATVLATNVWVARRR